MGLFNNQNNNQQLSLEQQRYNGARYNFLLLIGFTVINMIMLISNSNFYFLFSMRIPLVLTAAGIGLKQETGTAAFMILFLVLSVFIVLLYVPCYILSKRNPVWILVAAILFSLDTLFFLYAMSVAFDASMIIDALFHAFILFSLFRGYKFGKILKEIKKNPPPVINPMENLTPFYGHRDIPQEIVKDDQQQEVVANEEVANANTNEKDNVVK